MNKRRKLLVVTELFFPEETSTAYIMTKISQHLAQKREVQVICGPAVYQQSKIVGNHAVLDNIRITRVTAGDLDKDKLFQRVWRLISLSIKMSWKLWRNTRKGDEVLLVTNPAPLLLLAALICNLKGLKSYTIVHDVFPENLVVANLVKQNSFVYRFLRKIFNSAYSRMSVLLVLGRDMKALFEEKLKSYRHKPAIYIVENWADTEVVTPVRKDDNFLIKELNIEQKIVFQFAGNMGRVQGLPELFAVIKETRNPLLHFIFIGEGALKKELQQYAATKKTTNITILDSFPRSRQQEFLNATDVGIVSLQNGMTGLGVPSKSYNILAAGRPILYIGDLAGEIALMVEEHNVGWCFELNDKERLLGFFNALTADSLAAFRAKGEKARILAEERYAKEIILDKYAKILTVG